MRCGFRGGRLSTHTSPKNTALNTPAALQFNAATCVAHPSQAVVLAAGLGTRLRPFTETMPKAFVPVAGKPMIMHTLGSLRSIGVDSITLVTGYRAEVFEQRKVRARV